MYYILEKWQKWHIVSGWDNVWYRWTDGWHGLKKILVFWCAFIILFDVLTMMAGSRYCLFRDSTSRVCYSVRYVFCFRLDENVWLFYYDRRLPIVLFVRQHFSGSLFCAITLLLCVRETTQGKRGRRSKGAFPSPLRFSPSRSHFPDSFSLLP